jgi:8-amino-7-oxononanoate synthase
MDGDTRPAGRPAALAEAEGAVLVVDEAHATGVLGPGGRGLVATLGARANASSRCTRWARRWGRRRAAGGAAVLREFLVNRARGFIFSTAPSPLAAAIARAACACAKGGRSARRSGRAHRAGGRCWRRWAPRRMAPRSCR